MRTALAVKSKSQIARPLRVLVPLIQEDLARGRHAAEDAGMPYFRAAGEKLIEAKSHYSEAEIARGEFNQWATMHFGLAKPTLNRYIRYAKDVANEVDTAVTASTMTEYARITSPSYNRPSKWHEPVRLAVNKLNIERLTQERTNRETEARLTRELGFRLIDIGFKVLVTKMHPDHNEGRDDGMARLNRVRKLLRDAL